eukprot:1161575-Pelagomonas_calceolata.AAC.5
MVDMEVRGMSSLLAFRLLEAKKWCQGLSKSTDTAAAVATLHCYCVMDLLVTKALPKPQELLHPATQMDAYIHVTQRACNKRLASVRAH